MGFYVEPPCIKGKADWLIANKGAIELAEAPRSFDEIPDQQSLIVVVENRAFDAAGYCYDEREFRDFVQDYSDPRPKRYLLVDRNYARVESKFPKAMWDNPANK